MNGDISFTINTHFNLFPCGIGHCFDILIRNIGQNTFVAWTGDEVRTQRRFDPSNILHNLLRCTINKQILSVDTTNKSNFAREVAAKPFRMHIGRFCLDRVKRFYAKINKLGDHLVNGSTGMEQHLIPILMAQIRKLFEVGTNEFIELGGPNQKINL